MATFSIDYQAEHLEIGGKPSFLFAADGNTPTAAFPIRMLGIDAPEVRYGSAHEGKPGAYDKPMADFLSGKGKDLDPGLKEFLAPRLAAGACSRHIEAGRQAAEHFKKLAEKRLARVGKAGKPLAPRQLFVMVAQQAFDDAGRLLGCLNAAYSKDELKALPPARRPTFNLQMLQDGQATSLLIFPNLPKTADLELARKAVQTARAKKKGFWQQDETLLLGYELRWIIDMILGKRPGPTRYCADCTTGEVFKPQHYWRVLPENRVFFQLDDLSYAFDLGFWPAG